MKLSNAYKGFLYALVYDTGHDDEVELVSKCFFDEAGDAWTWFHKNYEVSDFINPRVVTVSGMNNLTLAAIIKNK
jgi:hypothetical protein